MAVGLPLKTTYANGDVFSASDINDTNGTINITAAPFAAGKNKIINGDFGVWQRGTSFNAGSNAFTADRWNTLTDKTGASVLTTQQAFTTGSAPVAGYEAQYFLRTVFPSGGSFCIQEQRIEDVRTFAGQTVTLSFWAKANATVSIAPTLLQNFGSGGSANVETTTSNQTLTTSWARYSVTATLPSITGKTIGAGSFLTTRVMRAVTASGFTIDIWGVQLEAGSTATAFQTATGTLQGELAACQRYYTRLNYQGSGAIAFGYGIVGNSTAAQIFVPLPVSMRPGSLLTIDYSNLRGNDFNNAYTISAITNASTFSGGNGQIVQITSTGMTQYRVIGLDTNSSGYIGFSAEL
jgi:hypothetical protein